MNRLTGFTRAARRTALLTAAALAVLACGGSDASAPTPRMVPVLLGYAPAPIWPGYGPVTVRFHGRYFLPSSVVRIDGADRATRFISDEALEVDLPAAFTATHGTHSVTVFTGPPGGGLSGALVLPVMNPFPVIDSLDPDSVTVGSATFEMTIFGSGFFPGSQVDVNYITALDVTFVSTSELRATVPAAVVSGAGEKWIRVLNDWPGGGSSVPRNLMTVNPVPVLDSIAPDSLPVGSGDTAMSAHGRNFVATVSRVRLDGVDASISNWTATRIDFIVPASRTGGATRLPVEILNDGPGGGTSQRRWLTVY